MSHDRWDNIRAVPTERGGVHESVFRSYQILQEVKLMLNRGDSPETVRRFIAWAEAQP